MYIQAHIIQIHSKDIIYIRCITQKRDEFYLILKWESHN